MQELRERDDGEVAEETRASCEVNIAQVCGCWRSARGRTRSCCRRRRPSGPEPSCAGASRSSRCSAPLTGSGTHGCGTAGRSRCVSGSRTPRRYGRPGAQLRVHVRLRRPDLGRAGAEYGTERERMVRSAEQLRAETVRRCSPGAGRRGVRRPPTGLRAPPPPRRAEGLRPRARARGLERAAREVAAVLGAGEPLVVGSGAASVDVWWGAYEPPESAALDAYAPPDGIFVVAGRPGHGIDGFRARTPTRWRRHAWRRWRAGTQPPSCATNASSSCRCWRATSRVRARSSQRGSGRWPLRPTRPRGCAKPCSPSSL